MNDIGIIIRMFHHNRAEMRWRLAYFQACVLPRLQAQTVQDFDIAILSYLQDHAALEEMDSRIKCFVLDMNKFDYKNQSNFKYDQTIGLKKYNNQIRMDSDDLVSPDFIDMILAADTPFVSFQPELFLLDELRTKKMKHRYRQDWPSMFLAVKRYPECIYHKVFLHFNDRPCTLYPEGDAWMTIHNHNVGTGKNS